MRLGSYVEGVATPIKIRLKAQSVTEEILARTFWIKDCEDYKQVFIKKNMNEENTKN